MADVTHETSGQIRNRANLRRTLEKYNRPGPRYTSYPTAPVWKDDFGPDDLEKFYARAEEQATPLSLYMHIPFCESLCLFCACNVSIQKDKKVAIPYLDALKREIDHVEPARFEEAPRDSISLGRRHADLSDSRADGRPFRLRARAFFVCAGRGDWNRNRPARHQSRASGNFAPPRIQPPEHGHSGFSAEGAGNNSSRAAL